MKRHSLAEAGESWWAPWWLLLSVRVFLALGLTTISAVLLADIINLFESQKYNLLSFLFWGPLVHAAGLSLLIACGLRGQDAFTSARLPAEGGKLPAVAVVVYQTGCTLTSFVGAVSMITRPSTTRPWLVATIGAFEILCFLVDTLVLGSKVRFRFVYTWIAVGVYALSLIVQLIVLLAVAAAALPARRVSGIVGGLFLNVLGVLITGLVETALTRAVNRVGVRVGHSRSAASETHGTVAPE